MVKEVVNYNVIRTVDVIQVSTNKLIYELSPTCVYSFLMSYERTNDALSLGSTRRPINKKGAIICKNSSTSQPRTASRHLARRSSRTWGLMDSIIRYLSSCKQRYILQKTTVTCKIYLGRPITVKQSIQHLRFASTAEQIQDYYLLPKTIKNLFALSCSRASLTVIFFS